MARAQQAVGPVAAVETAQTSANPSTGAYMLTVPTAAPRLLIYSNPMVTPLNFLAQAATAAKYRVAASATGYVPQLGSEVTVSPGVDTPVPGFALVVAGP
jgi:hypothetical protein